jgi:hypothetical protein
MYEIADLLLEVWQASDTIMNRLDQANHKLDLNRQASRERLLLEHF